MTNLIFLACMVFFPIVPAYLFFKLLPTSAEVTGPFQGLQMKLGGAFAGYIVVLLLVFSTSKVWNPPPPPPLVSVWTVTGRVMSADGNPIQPLTVGNITTDPQPLVPESDGNFRISVSTDLSPSGGTIYPELTFTHQPYQPITISLDPGKAKDYQAQGIDITTDISNKTIDLGNIILKNASDYTGAGQAPKPVTGSGVPAQ